MGYYPSDEYYMKLETQLAKLSKEELIFHGKRI
jgi:hypothetical protein